MILNGAALTLTAARAKATNALVENNIQIVGKVELGVLEDELEWKGVELSTASESEQGAQE